MQKVFFWFFLRGGDIVVVLCDVFVWSARIQQHIYSAVIPYLCMCFCVCAHVCVLVCACANVYTNKYTGQAPAPYEYKHAWNIFAWNIYNEKIVYVNSQTGKALALCNVSSKYKTYSSTHIHTATCKTNGNRKFLNVRFH
jgi:hypothetical protein